MARGRIPQSDVVAIRERTPIEEVVGDYVQLKPAGADSLKGLSPFKDEKTPSFHVRPQRGYFHCFSTGKGGDVFTFLMELEHVTFPEAVEMCAERIGYQINYEGGGAADREEPGLRRRLVAANRAAHEFYMAQLETPEAAIAREFLTARGFSAQHAHQFGCGYAPRGWDTLTNHLMKQGFTFKELEAAGLSTMGKRSAIDRFRGRLLWPIRNTSGDVIGFGARKLYEDDNLGKYMNTPETLLYKKSKVLFGLDLARKEIANLRQAVVVEGYTDVMAMHAAGVTNAVAACGTAFGEEHLQMLRRLLLDGQFVRGEVVYTFDGDEAGQKAAMRAFETSQVFNGQSSVSVAPDGMDPCDLRLKGGDAAVRQLIARRLPLIEFVMRALIGEYRLDTLDGRVQALNRVVPVLAVIRDNTLRNEYARKVSGWLGLPNEQEVLEKVRREVRAPKPQRRQARRFDDAQQQAAQPTAHLPQADNPALWAERESLKIALQWPQVAGAAFDATPDEFYTNEFYRKVRAAIRAAGGCAAQSRDVDFLAAVTADFHDVMAASFVSELVVEQIRVVNDRLPQYTDSVLARLEEQYTANRIAVLKTELQRMIPSEDEQAYNRMFQDVIDLELKRKHLLERVHRAN